MYNDQERNRALARAKLSEIKERLSYGHTNYDTMNTTDSYWKSYEEEIKSFPELDFLNLSDTIYSKLTDKQYIFNVEKPEDLRRTLSRALDEMLNGAEAVIDALMELNEKTLSKEEQNIRLRKQKLIELLIKSGKLDFGKLLIK